jgi:hypothetical protein
MEDFQLSIGQAGKRGMKVRAGRFVAATATVYREAVVYRDSSCLPRQQLFTATAAVYHDSRRFTATTDCYRAANLFAESADVMRRNRSQ